MRTIDQYFCGLADVVGVARRRRPQATRRLGDDVLDHGADKRRHRLGDDDAFGRVRMIGEDGGERVADERQAARVVETEEAGSQTVVDVVVVVGDVVGDGGDLRLKARPGVERKIVSRGVFADRHRQRLFPRADQRAVVLDDAFQRLPGQVEAVIGRLAALQLRQQAQGLRVVVEAVIVPHAVDEHVLAGVAEGRVAEIVRERDGLGEILVELEGAGDRP